MEQRRQNTPDWNGQLLDAAEPDQWKAVACFIDSAELDRLAMALKERLNGRETVKRLVRIEGLGCPINLSREDSEKRTLPLLERVTPAAQLAAEGRSVDCLVMVGGAAQMPHLRRRLSELISAYADIRYCSPEQAEVYRAVTGGQFVYTHAFALSPDRRKVCGLTKARCQQREVRIPERVAGETCCRELAQQLERSDGRKR